MKQYKSQCARDAQRTGYGDEAYWDYLEQAAIEHHDYYIRHGMVALAQSMLTQSLGAAISQNDNAS